MGISTVGLSLGLIGLQCSHLSSVDYKLLDGVNNVDSFVLLCSAISYLRNFPNDYIKIYDKFLENTRKD